MRLDEITATLRVPGDRPGWEMLLREENQRIARFLAVLGRVYRVAEEDLADVKQTALVRIVLESRRIENPKAYWHYWESILRSCLLDFVRARARYPHESLDAAEGVESPGRPDEGLPIREIARYLEGRSPLVREVGRGLALGESASETARRTGTTLGTVYVLRGRIRSDIGRLRSAV
jgi:DNA-directed RNA polymerase specialized sigma24 family protein